VSGIPTEQAPWAFLSFKTGAFQMSPQRILGIVLLIVGVIVLVVGMNASHSAADQLSSTFTGKFTDSTNWYIIGGIASAILGLLLVLFGVRGKSA
jgi:Protein of unknown function (DUF3185)